jgi:hypothetical protein
VTSPEHTAIGFGTFVALMATLTTLSRVPGDARRSAPARYWCCGPRDHGPSQVTRTSRASEFQALQRVNLRGHDAYADPDSRLPGERLLAQRAF